MNPEQEKKFEEFTAEKAMACGCHDRDCSQRTYEPKDLKDFMSSLVTETREQCAKEIEKEYRDLLAGTMTGECSLIVIENLAQRIRSLNKPQ